ncbi:cardiolipin synthase [uncultured Croceitalea sp.]|uniref:cardiolipin synthase n=1 Tax=uncultured Croceitalea sp. TaxID=1798908 RepID=UPI003305FC86
MINFYYLIVFAVCILIVLNARTPNKALAYIVMVILVPVLGILIYFLVGFDYRKKKLYQKKIQIDKQMFPELEREAIAFSVKSIEEHKNKLGHFYGLAKTRTITHLSSADNSVELLINGENKFNEVFKSLHAAKHHIHLEYYIYENDIVGNQLGDILIKKAKEGVKVRFIYDDFGSNTIRKKFIKKLKSSGIEVQAFYKIYFIAFANRLNYRNHRKIIVIDGRVGYVGGINVSNTYVNSPTNNTKLYWRDTHSKITGLSVHNLQFIFLTDWNFCAGQHLAFSEELFPPKTTEEHKRDCLVQVIASGPDSDYPDILFSYIQAVLLSKEEILLTTPYFIPDKAFLDALKIASLSGVTIKLLVPEKSDSAIVGAVSKSYYSELLQAGIQIFEYQRGFIHAKTAVFDKQVCSIGTANLDNRSFDLNFEVNALIYDSGVAQELSDSFSNDLLFANQINLKTWQRRTLLKQLTEKTARLIAPLL